MELLVSHVVLGIVIAVSSLCAGWWFRSHWPERLSVVGPGEAALAKELMVSLHRLSVRMAADVGEHHTRVGEVDRELAAKPAHAAPAIATLVGRLMKANGEVQAKLTNAESKLDELTQKMAYHAAEARTDALTGLANRRVFEEETVKRLSEFLATNCTFSIAIVDIDHFKRVNDAYGHLLGDDILRDVGVTLLQNVGGHNIVTRYGGEEFAILMPGATVEDARHCAAKLRATIEKTCFQSGGKTLEVTVSVGVAEVLSTEDVESLVHRADLAMYAAKHAGRNCVYWHDGTNSHRVNEPLAEQSLESSAPAEPDGPLTSETLEIAVKPETSEVVPEPSVFISDEEFRESDGIDLEVLGNLNNKTMFCQNVYRRIAEWKRGGSPFSTILLSIDNYRQLVHDHGVLAADLALGVVAETIRNSLRSADQVARYDEKTFGLVLPDALLRNALCIGERLRRDVRRTGIMIEGQAVHFTISLGIVEVSDGDQMASLLERAATQLGQASLGGGNRTSFAAKAFAAS
ncbi:MAG: GGDEF domain-containing protein [Pirellulaceae bacterium]